MSTQAARQMLNSDLFGLFCLFVLFFSFLFPLSLLGVDIVLTRLLMMMMKVPVVGMC